MNSIMFRLNLSDFQKAIIMAVLGGAVTAIASIVLAPGFNVFSANWHVLLSDSLTGALVSGVSYLVKNFFSNSQGKVFGKIG